MRHRGFLLLFWMFLKGNTFPQLLKKRIGSFCYSFSLEHVQTPCTAYGLLKIRLMMTAMPIQIQTSTASFSWCKVGCLNRGSASAMRLLTLLLRKCVQIWYRSPAIICSHLPTVSRDKAAQGTHRWGHFSIQRVKHGCAIWQMCLGKYKRTFRACLSPRWQANYLHWHLCVTWQTWHGKNPCCYPQHMSNKPLTRVWEISWRSNQWEQYHIRLFLFFIKAISYWTYLKLYSIEKMGIKSLTSL